MRLFYALTAFVFAVASIFSAWLTQGVLDGTIQVNPIGTMTQFEAELFAVCTGILLLFCSFVLFAIFGMLASDGRESKCN